MIQELIEDLTFRYLSAHHSEVKKHPFGRNSPPDFLVDSCVAVEATYLNEVYFADNERIDVDKFSSSKLQSLKNVIHRIEVSERKGSLYVSVEYSPKLNVRGATKDTKDKLALVSVSETSNELSFKINDHLSLDLFWTPTVHATPFRIGAVQVDSPGGLVIEDVFNGVTRIMREKKAKMLRAGRSFSQKWLCTGSAITTNLDDDEFSSLKDFVQPDGYWNRIILLDTVNIENTRIIIL